VTSELLSIPGIGPSKRGALIRAFGSVQGVRNAGTDAIAQLPGFSLASAQRILDALDRSNPTKATAPAGPAIVRPDDEESLSVGAPPDPGLTPPGEDETSSSVDPLADVPSAQ
jgi:excinuclease ABC subunit C